MTKLPTAQHLNELDQLLAELDEPAPTASSARLIFALDATASRQPTWDQAAHVQGEMFDAVARLGRLDVQLMFFRGDQGSRECKECSTGSSC